MHHPFHIHGAGRFLCSAETESRSQTSCGKTRCSCGPARASTSYCDVTNPGKWMAHCHIAEHNQSGMMILSPFDP